MSSQTAIYYDNKYMQKLYGEQVILKVLKANNNNNTVTIDNRDSNIYTRTKLRFVICKSCFWCVSLYSDSRTVKCPLCNSYSDLDSIPLSIQ
jgi:LSD1 subclass zinc finger protein